MPPAWWSPGLISWCWPAFHAYLPSPANSARLTAISRRSTIPPLRALLLMIFHLFQRFFKILISLTFKIWLFWKGLIEHFTLPFTFCKYIYFEWHHHWAYRQCVHTTAIPHADYHLFFSTPAAHSIIASPPTARLHLLAPKHATGMPWDWAHFGWFSRKPPAT